MSLLSKIRQEAQSPTVKVEPRIDALVSPSPAIADESAVTRLQPESIAQGEITGLQQRLDQFPTISPKKVGLRMEAQIQKDLQAYCLENDITPETLMEAYWTIVQSKEALSRQVLKEAQARATRRTEAGNLRSSITKLQNLKRSK
jgi:hypothetical protein